MASRRPIVGVRQEGVFDDHATTPPALKHLDEVLEEQERRLARADGKVLLHLLTFLPAKRGIRHHHIDAVLILNVGEILCEGVGVNDVVRSNAKSPDSWFMSLVGNCKFNYFVAQMTTHGAA